MFSRPAISAARRPASTRVSAGRRRGFALLITVTLLAFLVLLLVSLASLTRVETQVASNSQQLARARQNALFGLNVALGRLQQAAGPDQRVTATAGVLASTHATKRKWTGVWDTTTPAAAPVWLVSGDTPDATSAAAADVPAAGYTATDVRLVGPATADTTTTPGNGNEIVVPLQDIRGNGLPGVADVAGGTRIGRYGYWIGDEGVKARANLGDAHRAPWFSAAASGKSAPDPADQLDAAGLAQRSALELVSRDAGTTDLLKPYLDFDPADPAAKLAAVGRWLARGQLSLLDTADSAVLDAAGRARFHDLTLWSAGVQADVAQGGLKRDLTAAFEMSDADFQASDLADAAPANDRLQMAGVGNDAKFVSPVFNYPVGGGLYYHGPTWHLLRNHYRLYTQVAAPFTAPSIPTQLLGPTLRSWSLEAYTSFFNGTLLPDPKVNTLISDASYQPTPRVPPLPTRPAVLPYLNRITLVFSLQTADTGDLTSDGQPIYEVRIVVTPYVVLHNPYDVSLQLKSFHGATNDGRKNWGAVHLEYFPFSQLIYGYSKTAVGAAAAPYVFSPLPSTTPDRKRALTLSAAAFTYDSTLKPYDLISLYLPEMTLAPGEVRVFSPNSSTSPKVKPIGRQLNLDPNAYYESGYYFDCLNGCADYLNTGNSAVAPVPCPTGPDWTLQDPTPGDYHLRVPGNMPIKLMLTGMSNANFTDTTPTTVRLQMDSNDSVTIDGGSSTQAEIAIDALGMGAGAADVKSRTYSGYGASYDFETPTEERPAADYATDVPTPVCVYDIFLKPADQSANPDRPFVTNNPLAPVTKHGTAGRWLSSPGAGYPLANAAWQPQYRRLSGTGNAWSQGSLFAVDPNGSGRAYWGPSNTDAGLQNVSLIDVPTRPLTSLAQFQHLMISLYAHDPYFAIGNSCATPYDSPTALVTNAQYLTKGGSTKDWWIADVAYLANQALWDSSFFSTLSPGFDATAGAYYAGTNASDPLSRESIRDAWLAGTRVLPDARVIPWLSPQRDDATRKTQLLDYHKAAANLLVAGSFNVNSRSVEAWTAVLGGARKAPVPKTGGATASVGDNTAIPRALPAVGDARGSDLNNWNGFAQLTDAQIRALATALVARIAQRQTLDGRPFLSLAEFVNRRVAAPADPDLNAKGVLQAAIDDAGLNGAITGADVTTALQADFPFPSQGTGSSASAASGFLLQADVLQQIGPFLSARSDTFTLRAYGESVNPVTGATDGRAWCEAVVQRVPDYVNPADDPSAAPAAVSAESQTFGRRFQIVSFRWLSPADI